MNSESDPKPTLARYLTLWALLIGLSLLPIPLVEAWKSTNPLKGFFLGLVPMLVFGLVGLTMLSVFQFLIWVAVRRMFTWQRALLFALPQLLIPSLAIVEFVGTFPRSRHASRELHRFLGKPLPSSYRFVEQTYLSGIDPTHTITFKIAPDDFSTLMTRTGFEPTESSHPNIVDFSLSGADRHFMDSPPGHVLFVAYWETEQRCVFVDLSF